MLLWPNLEPFAFRQTTFLLCTFVFSPMLSPIHFNNCVVVVSVFVFLSLSLFLRTIAFNFGRIHQKPKKKTPNENKICTQSASSPRRVAVPVLVKDGKPCSSNSNNNSQQSQAQNQQNQHPQQQAQQQLNSNTTPSNTNNNVIVAEGNSL